jgi:hypothetical protein
MVGVFMTVMFKFYWSLTENPEPELDRKPLYAYMYQDNRRTSSSQTRKLDRKSLHVLIQEINTYKE